MCIRDSYGDDGSHQHLKLFLKGSPRPLSVVLPVFENMGVTAVSYTHLDVYKRQERLMLTPGIEKTNIITKSPAAKRAQSGGKP